MTLPVRRILVSVIAFLLAVPGVGLPAVPAGKGVLVATIAAPIGPVAADYLSSVIARAEEEDAALLVVELDTPGGLDSAMRQMVQAILKSRVPPGRFSGRIPFRPMLNGLRMHTSGTSTKR